MRRPNFKFILGALAVCLAVVAGFYFVHRMQSGRNARALIAQADRAEKKGDQAKAAQYLERYLSYAPGDAAMMARLGNLLMSDKPSPVQSRRVMAIFEKTLIVDPSLNDIRRTLAELELGARDYAAAETHLKFLQAHHPEDSGLELMRGQAQQGQGHDEDAIKSYTDARKHKPDQIEAYASLARLLRKQPSRVGEADAIMDAVAVEDGLIAHNPTSAIAHLDRAQYRKDFGLSGVEEDVSRALSLDPDHEEVILAAARVAQHPPHVDLDRARTLFARGLELHPKSVALHSDLIALEQRSGRYQEAAACLKRAIALLPERVELRWELADTLITLGDLVAATEAIEALQKTTVAPKGLDYLEARRQFAERKWTAAARSLEILAPALASQAGMDWLAKRAFILLGRCRENLGQTESQLAAFRRSLDISLADKALDIPAHLGIASALVARDRVEEAAEEYRKIMAMPSPPPEVGLTLARLLIYRDLRLPPAERRWRDAEQVLDRVDQLHPGLSQVATLRAEILAEQTSPDRALASIHEARVRAPGQVELWTAEALLAARLGKHEDATRILNEAEGQLGRSLELRMARARVLARRKDAGSLAALDELKRTSDDLGTDERRQFLTLLTELYTQAGGASQAQELNRRLAEEDPEDLPRRLTLFNRALADGDEATAKTLLTEIEKLDDSGTLGRYGRALLLIRQPDQARLAEARRLLTEVIRIRPDWSNAIVVHARVDEIEGRHDTALASYLRAIELGDKTPSAVLGASRLLFERGRFAQADQMLRKLQDRSGLSGEEQRLAADLALRSNDFGRAMENARTAIASSPTDFRSHLMLGRILELAGQQAIKDGHAEEKTRLFTEAETAFRKAVDLADGQRIAHVMLIQFLAAAGQKDQARAAVEQARRMVSPDQRLLALAQGLEAIGDPGETLNAYHEALAATPTDAATLQSAATYLVRTGESKEAETVLRRLVSLSEKAAGEADWARRVLAVLIASGGSAKRTQEALNLVDPSAAIGTASGDRGSATRSASDRRARVLVLATQPDRARRDEAIQILEGLNRDNDSTPNDRFLLARLYESAGNWPKARQVLQTLLSSSEGNPTLLVFLIDGLIRHGQVAESLAWVTRLERAAPQAPATIELKARALHASGRKPEALAAITSFVRDKEDQAIAFTSVLQSIQEPDAAEKILRQLIAKGHQEPKARLALILLLARQGRTAEAIQLCDETWKTAPNSTVSDAYVRILTAGTTDDATLDRIGQQMQDQLASHPDQVFIKIHLANLRSIQGKMSEAETIYRTAVVQEKSGAVSLNNLAWFLAFQPAKAAESLKLIDQAINLAGENPDLLDTRAIALMAANRPSDAVRDLENAIVLSPASDKYFHLARAYRMAGRRDDFVQAMKQARDRGLTKIDIQPLERQIYEELTADLARR